MRITTLYNYSRVYKINFIYLIFSHLYYKVCKGKNLLLYPHTIINGLPNLLIKGRLLVGLDAAGFSLPSDITMLSINGSLTSHGVNRISRGCRVEVGIGAKLELNNCFINSDVRIIFTQQIIIGDDSAIGWGTQICDNDFHVVTYANGLNVYRGRSQLPINIGKHVLIGNNCSIYKGSSIADGCVIASNSVVKHSIQEKNVLVAGNPAKIIKYITNWS